MENQEWINLLNNAWNQASKFITKIWVGINDDRNGTYDKFTYLKFKTTMQNASLCDYSDADILAVGRTTAAGQGAYAAAIAADRIKKELVFKNYAPFLKSTSKINEKDKIEDVDIVCKCVIY